MADDRRKQEHRKPKQLQQTASNDMAHMRWLVLAAGIGLLIIALVLRLQPSLLSKDTALASDVFGKVGIVFMCAWLAWPAIELIGKSPSGLALFVSIAFAAALFVYRPKTLWITGPFLAVAVVLAILLGWIRNQRR